MLLRDANAIIDRYARWISDCMGAEQVGEAVRISTPMLNRNNDVMSVVIAESKDGFIVSDFGETIGDLAFSGFDPMVGKRVEKLDETLRGFGVRRTPDGELYIKGTIDELPSRMNMLMQAMASVDDMFYLADDSKRNLFKDDVGLWLKNNGIRAIPNIQVTGRSGLEFRCDYAIAQFGDVPERIINTVNSPSESSIRNTLFGWLDIAGVRHADGYVFLNTKNARDGRVPDSVVAACLNYDVTPVLWGEDENNFIKALAA